MYRDLGAAGLVGAIIHRAVLDLADRRRAVRADAWRYLSGPMLKADLLMVGVPAARVAKLLDRAGVKIPTESE